MKQFLQTTKQYLPVVIVALIMLSAHVASAVGVVDAQITQAESDAQATFTLVKGAAVTFLVFAIGYRFARKWLK